VACSTILETVAFLHSRSGSLAESIQPYPSVRINAVISETMKARKLGIVKLIVEILAQRKRISSGCYCVHSNAQLWDQQF